MPMYRDWVPKAVRPWIYLLFALTFQLTGTYYLGATGQMVGSTGLMREDVMMVGMMGVVGVNMPFPFLFRFKFRFTNHQLLLAAASVIVVCNVATLYTTNVPLLCAIGYVAGFAKLCGTFECFSNIRLWISPKQIFGVFLPSIYIVILGAQGLCTWLTQQLTYYYSWQAMNWFMTAVLIALILVVMCCTKNFRFMKPLPLVSLDWLGCLLWSALMVEVIWLFTYGEYYNWTDSPLWRAVALAVPVTLAVTVGRMRHIRHPYIEAGLWRHSRLVAILAMFAIAEMMNATPRVLLNTLTGGVLHWGMMTTTSLNLWEVAGSALGCGMTIAWTLWARRPFTQLLIVGFFMLLMHQVMMYFYVSPTLNVERLVLPTVLRTAGYAVFFATMTLYLKELIEFPAFFMALTMSGFIRNGVVESVFTGIYSHHLRYFIADTAARGQHYDLPQTLMIAVKQSYGWVCIVGVVLLLLMMVYEFQPVRSTVKKMPHLNVLRRTYVKQLRHDRQAVS